MGGYGVPPGERILFPPDRGRDLFYYQAGGGGTFFHQTGGGGEIFPPIIQETHFVQPSNI